ncbi:MAG TPA: YfiR family protein [Verrucomicrobiae bacterium]|nr:YfiR family protein [Verrucomicrobiae bacterium]
MAILIQGSGARWRWGWLAAILLAMHAPVRAQVDEYQVKAAFLYNFAKFVDWPAQSFRTPDEPIEVCVLSSNPFGSSLEQVIRGKTAAGRPLSARKVADAPSLNSCHILFVAAEDVKKFRALAPKLRGAPLLTVGEASDFISAGGIVNFKIENGKVRFEINVEAAEQGQLRISSKLLSLAEVVRQP